VTGLLPRADKLGFDVGEYYLAGCATFNRSDACGCLTIQIAALWGHSPCAPCLMCSATSQAVSKGLDCEVPLVGWLGDVEEYCMRFQAIAFSGKYPKLSSSTADDTGAALLVVRDSSACCVYGKNSVHVEAKVQMRTVFLGIRRVPNMHLKQNAFHGAGCEGCAAFLALASCRTACTQRRCAYVVDDVCLTSVWLCLMHRSLPRSVLSLCVSPLGFCLVLFYSLLNALYISAQSGECIQGIGIVQTMVFKGTCISRVARVLRASGRERETWCSQHVECERNLCVSHQNVCEVRTTATVLREECDPLVGILLKEVRKVLCGTLASIQGLLFLIHEAFGPMLPFAATSCGWVSLFRPSTQSGSQDWGCSVMPGGACGLWPVRRCPTFHRHQWGGAEYERLADSSSSTALHEKRIHWRRCMEDRMEVKASFENLEEEAVHQVRLTRCPQHRLRHISGKPSCATGTWPSFSSMVLLLCLVSINAASGNQQPAECAAVQPLEKNACITMKHQLTEKELAASHVAHTSGCTSGDSSRQRLPERGVAAGYVAHIGSPVLEGEATQVLQDTEASYIGGMLRRLWEKAISLRSRPVSSSLHLDTAATESETAISALTPRERDAVSNARLPRSHHRCPKSNIQKAAILAQTLSRSSGSKGAQMSAQARPRLSTRLVHFVMRDTSAALLTGILVFVLMMRLVAVPTQVWVHALRMVWIWGWWLSYAMAVGLLLGPMMAAVAVWGFVVLPAVVTIVLLGVLLCFSGC
jgi:hypothetical protein